MILSHFLDWGRNRAARSLMRPFKHLDVHINHNIRDKNAQSARGNTMPAHKLQLLPWSLHCDARHVRILYTTFQSLQMHPAISSLSSPQAVCRARQVIVALDCTSTTGVVGVAPCHAQHSIEDAKMDPVLPAGGYCLATVFGTESLSETVRFTTILPGVESGSTQK